MGLSLFLKYVHAAEIYIFSLSDFKYKKQKTPNFTDPWPFHQLWPMQNLLASKMDSLRILLKISHFLNSYIFDSMHHFCQWHSTVAKGVTYKNSVTQYFLIAIWKSVHVQLISAPYPPHQTPSKWFSSTWTLHQYYDAWEHSPFQFHHKLQ